MLFILLSYLKPYFLKIIYIFSFLEKKKHFFLNNILI